MIVLRWLAFFVLGDIIVATVALAGVEGLIHVWFIVDAIWTTAFDPNYEPYGIRAAPSLYRLMLEGTMGLFGITILMILGPGTLGAFGLANASLENNGWRFWTWF